MYEFFADPPWYLPVMAALIAIALLFQGNARQNIRMKIAGLLLAAAAAVSIGLGYFLESEPEQIIRRSTEVTDAVNAKDWKAFTAYLDPKVRFSMYAGRDQLAQGAAKSVDAIGVKNISLSNFVVTPETGAYRVDFRAMADIDVTARRTPTDWRFFWSKDPATGAFLLYNVEYVPNQQFGADTVNSRLVRPSNGVVK